MTVLAVGLCGGLGAIARFLVDTWLRRAHPTGFPLPTLAINVTGSFVLGVVTAMVVHGSAPDSVRLAVGVGFCGGYTTFSTAMAETVALARERRLLSAAANLLGTPALAVVAAALGYAVVGLVG